MSKLSKEKFQALAEMIDQLGNKQAQTVPKQTNTTIDPLSASDQLRSFRMFIESFNANEQFLLAGQEILENFLANETEVLDEEEIEEATTLDKVLRQNYKAGADPLTKGGKSLINYIHKFERVADTAEWDSVGTGRSQRVQLKLFKSSPDTLMIIKGDRGVAFAKPDKAYIDRKTKEYADKGKFYDSSGDTHLRYKVIAFSNDNVRLDNMLIPDEYETEIVNGKEVDKKDANGNKIIKVDNSFRRKRGLLSPTAPASTITIRRAGTPNEPDRQNPENFFDQLRKEIGNIRGTYIATSRMGGLKPDDAKKFKKQFEPQPIPKPGLEKVFDPETGTEKAVKVPYISAPKPDELTLKPTTVKRATSWQPRRTAYGEPEVVPGTIRKAGGIAKDVSGERMQRRTEFTPGQFTTTAAHGAENVVKSLHGALDSILPRGIEKLNAQVTSLRGAGQHDDADSIDDLKKKIQASSAALHDTPIDFNSEPMHDLMRAVSRTVASYTKPSDTYEVMRLLQRKNPEAVKQFWSEFLNKMDNPDLWS